MKKSIKIYLVLIATTISFSCRRSSEEKFLPGKIAIRKSQADSIEVVIFENKENTRAFKVSKRGEIQYSGFTWLNTEDAFIGTEDIPGESSIEYQASILKFDLKGKVIDRIYNARKGELAWPGYASKDDKYFLFTIHTIKDYRQYPFEGLTPMLSLKIMDLRTKKIIITIDSIGRSPNFGLYESPWLIDGKRFVYSLSDDTKIMNEGSIISSGKRKPGLYIYDLITGEDRMIVADAYRAIASPVANQIAYEKKESICVLSLDNNSEKIIYKKGFNEKIRDIHWCPDGKSIYLAYVGQYNTGLLNDVGEKLISIEDGKEITFKKIHHGFHLYSWK